MTRHRPLPSPPVYDGSRWAGAGPCRATDQRETCPTEASQSGGVGSYRGRFFARGALTAARRIKPTSPHCRSARQPNPGRRSTYRCGDSVQTTGTSSFCCPRTVLELPGSLAALSPFRPHVWVAPETNRRSGSAAKVRAASIRTRLFGGRSATTTQPMTPNANRAAATIQGSRSMASFFWR
jgi:hypothetical protein